MLRDLLQDLRYGLRSLRRSPVFTVVVVATLAVGLGANASIFSIINGLLLRPLPFRDGERLVLFSHGFAMGRITEPLRGRVDLYPYPLYQRLLADNTAFEDLAAEDNLRVGTVVRWTGPVEERSADFAFNRYVGPNYFSVLGVRPFRGRTFLPQEEGRAGAEPVVVLGHEYWQRRFGGDQQVVGARITLNRRPYTVVGIAAPTFVGLDVGQPTDLWVPFEAMANEFRGERSLLTSPQQRWINIVGRLKPGVSMAEAEAKVNVTLRQWITDHPGFARDAAASQAVRIVLQPGAMGASGLREGFREPLRALMAGVALLLLIVCLNVSHLLLARATQRQRELSVRTALGASRARLVRQLLTEALLLAGLGAALGALLRRWLSDSLISLAMSGQPSYMPLVLDLQADGRVVGFMLLLAAGTAVVLGLVPAWQASLTQPQQVLRATAQSVSGGRRLVSRILLASQVALSVVLLVAAGLLAGSLGRLRSFDRGIDTEHVLLARISTEFAGLSPEQGLALQDELLRRVTALPGVRGASLSYGGDVGSAGIGQAFSIPGTTNVGRLAIAVVTGGHFETVGMRLLRGRTFGPEDRAGAPRVLIVNETLARRLFGDTDVVGKQLRFEEPGGGSTPVEIVGLLRDIRLDPRQRAPRQLAYIPAAQTSYFVGALEVRTAGDPSLLAEQVRRTVLEVNPNLPVRNLRTMRAQLDRGLMAERFMTTVATAFGAVALLLVCVGLYGVISQWAGQRTREIGVRMALGATAGGVRWLVLRQALLLVLIGVGAGIPAAVVVARLLQSRIYDLRPSDPATLALAALAMFAVASAAAYLPARRASRVDPMAALRSE
jgi:predicted permease